MDPALFLTAIEGGPSDSAYAQLKGKMMISGDTSPSFSLGGLIKDMNLMVAAAAGTGFDDALLQVTTPTTRPRPRPPGPVRTSPRSITIHRPASLDGECRRAQAEAG